MFRAIWLWILGPVWEVRIVSTTTGKDIPGRCVYKGSYWRARKQFKKTKGKYGDMIRLQAVVRADWKMNEKPDIPKKMWTAKPQQGHTYLEDTHECDEDGPLEWDEGPHIYVPTCSVCGDRG